MFYVAFLVQFIDPQAAQLPQFLILMMTSSAIVTGVLGAYALLGVRAGQRLRTVQAQRRAGYASGSFLLGVVC